MCAWKADYQAMRVPQASIISWSSQKIEFSKGIMEKTLGLNNGQAVWHIKKQAKVKDM